MIFSNPVNNIPDISLTCSKFPDISQVFQTSGHPEFYDSITRQRDLEEVLDALRVVAATFAADSLHLLHLTGLARRLDVLEVHLRVLTEVHD